MKKSRNPWLIFFFVSLITKIEADDQLCKRTRNCQCFNNSDNYEYQCLNKEEEGEEEEEVILHIYPNSLINIDCNNLKILNADKLPKVKFENIRKLQIRYCPVPSNGIREIVQHFGMKNLESLSFEYGIVGNLTLENGRFQDISNVTELRLRANDIKLIEENFFDNFPKLLSLELDRNQLQLDSEIFLNLRDLKFLSLSDNKLERIPEKTFENLGNLHKLNLWKNNLKSLNQQSFKGLNKLKSLELAYNKLENVEFNNLPNIVNISVRSNSLGNLTKKMFTFNTNLERFEAGGNPNLQLQDAVFSSLKNLKKIHLENCNLKYVPEDLFGNSTNIQSISLGNNTIEELPKKLFNNLKQLKDLQLNNNKLNNLHDEIFANLTNLETLNVQQNELLEINEKLLKNCKKLKEFNASHNRISRIHLDAFARCKNLIKLDVSHNNYRYEDKGFFAISPFNKCADLQEIYLSHNEIMDFPEDLMILVNLKMIDLSWNNITYIRVNALWKVTLNELKINLKNNKISRLNFENVETTAMQQPRLDAFHNTDAATVVEISQNPLICDCFAYDFIRYLTGEMYPGVKTAIFFVHDEAECEFPTIFRGIKVDALTPPMLTCPIHDVIENFRCTNADCGCGWRPYDSALIIDCDSRNLTEIPEIYQPKQLVFNQTEVHLEANLLRDGLLKNVTGYSNVTRLYLGKNKIERILWIPAKIEVLDLSDNRLIDVPWESLEILNTTTLKNASFHGNPWKCNCATSNFSSFLRENIHRIDTRRIFCDGTSNQLINLNDSDLCPHSSILLITAIILIISLCILSSSAAFYYKYQQEIKVWLYAHNILLFLIEEEELDKDKKYDAFISYSHKDEDFVIENLISILESGPEPYKLCLHYRNWIPGEFIAKQVTSSVKDSRRTLVILSANFLESVWGKMEFRTAHTEAMQEGRARVIVVLLGDVSMDALDDELKAYLKTNTYIKWGDPWFYDRLKYALPHSKTRKNDGIATRKQAEMMKYIDEKFSTGKILENPDVKVKIEDIIDDNANKRQIMV